MVSIKNNKFIATLLVVLLLIVCSVTCIVNAESKLTITLEGSGQGHEYQAYQVFEGLLDEGKTGVLSNVKWGSGVESTELLNALKSSGITVSERRLKADGTGSEPTGSTKALSEIFADCTYARDVAEVLELYEYDSDMAQAFAEIVSEHLTSEYVTSTYSDNVYKMEVDNAGYYFIKDSKDLAGTSEAYTRYILQVIKDQKIKVKGSVPTLEKTESIDGEEVLKALSAEIGDVINYKLEGTLPTTYDDYTTYKYAFSDTLSAGLDYVTDSLKVFLVNDDGIEQDITSKFTVSAEVKNISVSIENLKTIAEVNKDSKIVVKYQAKLTKDAVVGDEGNTNKAHLEFSNNPNVEGQESTTTTPEEKVKVFTYEFSIKKLNGKTQQALEGVGFKLYKQEDGKTLYAQVDGATNTLMGWTEDIDQATELSTDAQGHTSVNGLKAGTYYLKETTVLDGYNKMNDVTIEIDEELTGNLENEFTQSLDNLSLKATVVENGKEKSITSEGNVDTGTVEATVLNYPGSLLPGTGGIGTVIFYVIGGILVFGSALFLIKTKSLNR